VDEGVRPYAYTTSKPLRKTKKVRMHSRVATIDHDQKVNAPLNDTKTPCAATSSYWAGNKYDGPLPSYEVFSTPETKLQN